MNIKPIETLYRGYRFRSRLEAKWAVFLDAVGAEWEYEPEGYDLGDGDWYLPDFRVTKFLDGGRGPKFTIWIEIKPNSDDGERANELMSKLVSGFGNADNWGLLVFGPPYDFCGAFYEHYPEGHNGIHRYVTATKYLNALDEFNGAIAKAQQTRFEHGEKST